MYQRPLSSKDSANLAVPIDRLVFRKEDYSNLFEVLADCERATDTWLIGDESQLSLSRKGTTVNGNKFSWLALRQICRVLSTGLSLSLSDLLGMRRNRETPDFSRAGPLDPDDDFTTGEAASLFNLALKKRFGRIYGFQSIVNSETKVIEAIVGGRYRRLCNSEFLSAVVSVVEALPTPVVFESAVLSDRKLSLVFLLKNLTRPSYMSPGVKLVNSEIGDSAVKASIVLVDPLGASMSSPSSKLSRVSHSGKDLIGKIAKLISDTVVKLELARFSEEQLSAKFDKLSANLLGFTGGDEDETRFKQMLNHMVTNKWLTYSTARKCLSSVLTEKEGSGSFSMLDRGKSWPSKSVMDFIKIVMRESTAQCVSGFSSLDRLDKVAWSLFFEKIQFPSSESE